MAILKPFKALLPKPDLAKKVSAPPYDVVSISEIKELIRENPYSILRVERSESELDQDVDPYSAQVYEKAEKNLLNMIQHGDLIEDVRDSYYIYMQIIGDRCQTGLVCCCSIDNYLNGSIKPHEETMAIRENDRMNHLDYLNANVSPVFMTYKGQDDINLVINQYTDEHDPIFEFTDEENIINKIWKIDHIPTVENLTNLFKKVDTTYIADGHHLTAAAVKVGLKRREENPDYDGTEEFNYFLSALYPAESLYILDYNRLIRDLNEFSSSEFVELVKESFEVTPLDPPEQYKPENPRTFGMYLDDRWYKLEPKPEIYNPDDSIEKLDVSILHNTILNPILSIVDPRIDERIDFVGGTKGLTELELRVSDGMRIAFSLYPTSMDDLIRLADLDKIMPPKSTWFEPKLRSGLFIHRI